MKVERLQKSHEKLASRIGYHLNPDPRERREIFEGLLANKKRYGYASCPCRLAEGNFKDDKPIICPCVYMPADVEEYGRCYCTLYVSKDFVSGKKKYRPIPDRHLTEGPGKYRGRKSELIKK